MKLLKRLGAGLVKLAVLPVLFLGSCVGPGVMYYQSPWWFLDSFDQGKTGSFYVAYKSKESGGSQPVQVMRYRFDSDKGKYAGFQFHLPNGHLDYRFSTGEGSARISATVEAGGSQLVQVFVVGDTPWSSLSEYRVADNNVHPLRHAHSVGWFLLAAVILPFLVWPLGKPIRRGIDRLMQIEPEQIRPSHSKK